MESLPPQLLIEDLIKRSKCAVCGKCRPRVTHGHDGKPQESRHPRDMTVAERLVKMGRLYRNRPRSLIYETFRHDRLWILKEMFKENRGEITLYHASVYADWFVRIDGGLLCVGSEMEKDIPACTDADDMEVALAFKAVFTDVIQELQKHKREGGPGD